MPQPDLGTPYYVGCDAVQAATPPPPELLENGAAFARLAEGSSRAGRVISRLRSLRFCLSTNLTAKPLGKSLTTRPMQLQRRAAFQPAAALQRIPRRRRSTCR